MNRLFEVLDRCAHDLNAARRQWAVIGGLAVGARVKPRFTQDVDLVVVVSDDTDAEGLVHHLLSCGWRTLVSLEHAEAKRLATVRMLAPGESRGGVIADLLFASSGIEKEIAASADHIAIRPGTAVPVATISHLLALKVLARDDRRRPEDRVDIARILERATPQDIQTAREALRLITARGYARDKNLEAELDAAVEEFRPD